MKNSIFTVVLLVLFNGAVCSQQIMNNLGVQRNEVIKQIHNADVDDVMKFQTLNANLSNKTVSLPAVIKDRASGFQQHGASADISNHIISQQSGSFNELSAQQIGGGNQLLCFQLGYLALPNANLQIGDTYTQKRSSAVLDNQRSIGAYVIEGESNKMCVIQNGTNNDVVAVQQGSANYFSAQQIGSNNNLQALQSGINNKVIGYKQENNTEHVLSDKIIQLGENISLESVGSSNSSLNGNAFFQAGTNLSLQVNTEFSNSQSGIEINQKGRDMKVIVEQSIFSFPMR